MNTKTTYSAICNKGKVRSENQDKIYISGTEPRFYQEVYLSGNTDVPRPLFAVFDGMGGELYGEKASEIAFNVTKENTDIKLDNLCHRINNQLCNHMKENHIKSMGTTAAIVRFSDDKVEICNIGDSKIYLIEKNGMNQLSVDHSMTIGKMLPRRVLTQHLGIPEEEMLIEPFISSTVLPEGSCLLLCSDGLTDMVNEEDILKIVNSDTTKLPTEDLFNAAMENGGTDNISIIICKREES